MIHGSVIWTDRELADYMAEHPEANFRTVTDPNDGTYVDLDGTICDECEDFYTDEYALALAEGRRGSRSATVLR